MIHVNIGVLYLFTHESDRVIDAKPIDDSMCPSPYTFVPSESVIPHPSSNPIPRLQHHDITA